jgi:tetrahydromethanopterin S-methyltransferase subunit E
MLIMAVAAVYLAMVRHQPNNIGGGILTFYLIGNGMVDWVVLLIPLALGILTWMNGLKVLRSGASSRDGVPVGMTFFMGS